MHSFAVTVLVLTLSLKRLTAFFTHKKTKIQQVGAEQNFRHPCWHAVLLWGRARPLAPLFKHCRREYAVGVTRRVTSEGVLLKQHALCPAYQILTLTQIHTHARAHTVRCSLCLHFTAERSQRSCYGYVQGYKMAAQSLLCLCSVSSVHKCWKFVLRCMHARLGRERVWTVRIGVKME